MWWQSLQQGWRMALQTIFLTGGVSVNRNVPAWKHAMWSSSTNPLCSACSHELATARWMSAWSVAVRLCSWPKEFTVKCPFLNDSILPHRKKRSSYACGKSEVLRQNVTLRQAVSSTQPCPTIFHMREYGPFTPNLQDLENARSLFASERAKLWEAWVN